MGPEASSLKALRDHDRLFTSRPISQSLTASVSALPAEPSLGVCGPLLSGGSGELPLLTISLSGFKGPAPWGSQGRGTH